MSESGEETSGNDSPVIKSRPMAGNESASESSHSEQEESTSESDQQPETVEKATVKNKIPVTVATKPSTAPKPKAAPRPAIARTKSYDAMVLDAMNALNGNKKSGVSIISVLKYVQANMEERDKFKRTMFKKAIDKALKTEMFVHTSGVGMSGSITFSAEHKKNLKLEEKKQAKAAKAAEKLAAAKAKLSAKSSKRPSKPKKLHQDENNNTAPKKAGAKVKKVRLSIAVLPTVKAKAKPKPRAAAKPKTTELNAKANKGPTKAGPSKAAGPSTKTAASTTRAAAGKGKAGASKT